MVTRIVGSSIGTALQGLGLTAAADGTMIIPKQQEQISDLYRQFIDHGVQIKTMKEQLNVATVQLSEVRKELLDTGAQRHEQVLGLFESLVQMIKGGNTGGGQTNTNQETASRQQGSREPNSSGP
jgi:hypothetical protein